MGLPLGRSTPRPSLRFWGWWDPAATSSGRCVRDINRKARGHNDCRKLVKLWFGGKTFEGRRWILLMLGLLWWTLRSRTWPALGRPRWLSAPLSLTTSSSITPAGETRWFEHSLSWNESALYSSEVTVPNIHFKWLCPIFIRFYMMRKAPSVHPAMSEHYNVWSDLQPNQEKNNSMMPYLLFNRLNWINAMMKENHVAIICW